MITNNVNSQNSTSNNTRKSAPLNVAGMLVTGVTTSLTSGLINVLSENKSLVDSFEKTTGKIIDKSPLKKGMIISGLLGIFTAFIYAATPAGKLNNQENK